MRDNMAGVAPAVNTAVRTIFIMAHSTLPSPLLALSIRRTESKRAERQLSPLGRVYNRLHVFWNVRIVRLCVTVSHEIGRAQNEKVECERREEKSKERRNDCGVVAVFLDLRKLRIVDFGSPLQILELLIITKAVSSDVEEINQVLQGESTKLSDLAFTVCSVRKFGFPVNPEESENCLQ